MGHGYKKGLTMALLFGLGLTITIASYGIAIAAIGQSASLDQASTIMFLIAGFAAFIFGLSQLKLISLRSSIIFRHPKIHTESWGTYKVIFHGIVT